MVLCIVVGCGSKSERHKGIGFFRIPSVINTQGQEFEERRERWISAISRDDTRTKDVLESERVCGRHFVSGKPAQSWDKHNVDWIPTLNLGKKIYKEKNVEASTERAERAKARRKSAIERQEQEAAKKRKFLNQTGKRVRDIDFAGTASSSSERDDDILSEAVEMMEFGPEEAGLTSVVSASCEEGDLSLNMAAAVGLVAETQCGDPSAVYGAIGEENAGGMGAKVSSSAESPETKDTQLASAASASGEDSSDANLGLAATVADAETQTEEFEYMFARPQRYQAPGKDFFNSDEKVRFYTGLPSFEILMVVFDHVSPYVTRKTQSLDRFQELVMVLMKLRLNVLFQDLAYRFMVSLSTVSRIFSSWMIVMDTRLSSLVFWPEREQLWRTMPMCFQYAFGKKVTVIIDCFEVFIEKPTNLLARAQTFSSYKHHNTIKILIGITPQGTVSFVSETWGGRTSDKHLTENCGFLNKLSPEDIVMADRGFTITESVGLQQAKLLIPAFTKGKSQLDPVDVEQTRGIASVRIHVERVIGLLRRKYTILESTLPTDFLSCNANGSPDTKVPVIDRIVRVCSALVNLCPPIVPFD